MNQIVNNPSELEAKIRQLRGRHVITLDANTVILAWRDSDTYKGVPYDKYRIAPWYWSRRDGAWLQGKGSIAVNYADRMALLAAFMRLHADELAVAKLSGMSSSAA